MKKYPIEPLVLEDNVVELIKDDNYIITIKVNYQDKLEYFHTNDPVYCAGLISNFIRDKYMDNYIIQVNIYHKKHGQFIHSIII